MTRILALFLFASMGWATQGPILIPAPGSPVAVGPGSGNVLLGDLNRDGHLDLVAGHLETRKVTVELGDGTGRFAPAPGSPLVLKYMPGDIKLGDVNGDGVLDLGITNSDRDVVEIFLGNGKGSFSLAPGSPFPVSSSTEFYTRSLHLVDINEDGKLDIVTANSRRNTFGTLLGNGRGGFSPGPSTKFDLESGQGRIMFAFGDVDGDGHLDVVALSGAGAELGPGRVVVQRGDGKGVFKNTSGPALSVPPGAFSVILVDMNGDQRLDLVMSHGSNDLSLLLNNGRGSFAPAPGSPYSLGTEGWEVAVGDINRDGKKDLVVATVESVTVLLGDGRGFAAAPGSPFRAGPGSFHLTAGDLNGDGKPDVVASSFGGNAMTVLLSR